jgi:hypothetical protein
MWMNIALWFATSKTGRAIAAALGVAVAIGVAVLKVFEAGRKSERVEQDRQTLDNMRSRAETDAEIENLGPADLDERAKRWMRNAQQRDPL